MASREQFLQKQKNIVDILSIIRNSELSRREIASKLGLSWACVSEIVSECLQSGLIVEESVNIGGKGRNPSVLRVNDGKYFVGVDVNVMGISTYLCSFSGKPINFNKGNALTITSEESLVCEVVKAIKKQTYGYEKNVLGIGVAMQGIYDAKRGVWQFPSKEGGIFVAIKSELERAFSLPVIVEHDPNCMLYGCTGTENYRSVMMARIDKGIGLAICKNGRFFTSGKLELGYTVMDGDGTTLNEIIFSADIEQLDENNLSENDTIKLKKVGKYLGVALANTCNLISIDEIILCGELMKFDKYILDELVAVYDRVVIQKERANIRSVLVTDASLGSAMLALSRYPYYFEA